MQYVAYHRSEVLTDGPDLDEVLAFVASCCDPSIPEDAVIYHGGLIAAVVMSTGPPPSASRRCSAS